MIRLALLIGSTVLLVAFVMMNMHLVTLNVVVGPPVQIRLIFLLLTAFFIGLALSWSFKAIRKTRARRRARSPLSREDEPSLDDL